MILNTVWAKDERYNPLFNQPHPWEYLQLVQSRGWNIESEFVIHEYTYDPTIDYEA